MKQIVYIEKASRKHDCSACRKPADCRMYANNSHWCLECAQQRGLRIRIYYPTLGFKLKWFYYKITRKWRKTSEGWVLRDCNNPFINFFS